MTRLILIIFLLHLYSTPLLAAPEQENLPDNQAEESKTDDEPISDEDRELIANLELLELYELLENFNALASMEDAQ